MSDTTAQASYLTQEAYDRLEAELQHLSTEGRSEISKRIEAARDEGDLKDIYELSVRSFFRELKLKND